MQRHALDLGKRDMSANGLNQSTPCDRDLTVVGGVMDQQLELGKDLHPGGHSPPGEVPGWGHRLVAVTGKTGARRGNGEPIPKFQTNVRRLGLRWGPEPVAGNSPSSSQPGVSDSSQVIEFPRATPQGQLAATGSRSPELEDPAAESMHETSGTPSEQDTSPADPPPMSLVLLTLPWASGTLMPGPDGTPQRIAKIEVTITSEDGHQKQFALTERGGNWWPPGRSI